MTMCDRHPHSSRARTWLRRIAVAGIVLNVAYFAVGLVLNRLHISVGGDLVAGEFFGAYPYHFYRLFWAYGGLPFFVILLAFDAGYKGVSYCMDRFTPTRVHTFLLIGLIVCMTVFIAGDVLDGFPNSGDESSFVQHAHVLARGKLGEDPPAEELGPLFDHFYFISTNGRWLTKYPPGWPVMLAGAQVIGMPLWLVNPIIGAVSLLLIHAITRRLTSEKGAFFTVLVTGFSPFFLFNAASFFQHLPCLLFALLSGWLLVLFLESENKVFLVLSGVALGCAFLIREYTALWLGFSFAVGILLTRKPRVFGWLPLLGVGAALPVGLYLYYNGRITGNPLQPPSVLLGADTFALSGVGELMRRGFFVAARCLMLNLWASPFFLLSYPLMLAYAVWRKRRTVNLFAVCFLFIAGGYFLFAGGGGNQYGPRYYFEGYALSLVFIAVTAFALVNDRSVAWVGRLTVMLGLASVVYGIAMLPYICHFEHRIVEQRQDVYRLAEMEGLSNAVVLIKSSTSPLRRMGPKDLTRNYFHVERDVLYLVYSDDAVALVEKWYPRRAVYVYVRESEESQGRLIPPQKSHL